jgi:exo-beta-1,3-glucanase (GH17 family)/glycosyltransferase involved in cell wall biosynthesis
MKKTAIFLITLCFLVITNLVFWAYLNQPQNAGEWDGVITGFSFNPLRRNHDPLKQLYPTREEIDQDLELLKDKTHAVRTYSVNYGLDVIPELAAKYRLNVTVGAWIGRDAVANQQEVDKLIAVSRLGHNNIVRTMVGNEAILREDLSVGELIHFIRQVKSQTWRPVSTSETWHTWLKYPELANEVDFIAAHILPYWEGIPANEAVDYVFKRYYELQKAFPDKQIIITETGWPSNGQPIRQAKGTVFNQVRFLREFLNRAHAENVVYYVVEAFDQPWKMNQEGSSGAYWGLYDVERQPKFSMRGAVQILPKWRRWALGAVSVSVLITSIFLFNRKRLKLPGVVFFGLIANLGASTIAWTASIGAHQYQTAFTTFLWGLLLLMQALALLVLLVESLEIAEVLWNKTGKRNFKPLTPGSNFTYPKVSLHVPIHNEPPDMVRLTLEAINELDYPNLEVLIIDNNTTDPEIWQPVEKDCERLGSNFRFFHLENWPGYKAGALNYALEQTAEDAEIIAVIDSDYIVSSDWLKSLVPYFENPDIGFVQAPQNYHDWQGRGFKAMCQWEYAGFFNIGMVQRNEYNAIIQHGTMTMIRKSALKVVGKWGEWCICEDSELGLRLYKAGYDSVYVKDTFGQGVTPDTLSGYILQRHRWVYGAMQILKAHWRSLFSFGKTDLTPAQRYYFVAGWLPWFSDALALMFTVTSLILTARVFIDPVAGELPIAAFVLPTIGLFGFKVVRSFWLYRVRVNCTLLQTLGATIAGLSLTHTVAVATLQGLVTSGRPFLRTPKLEKERPFLAGLSTIRQELCFLILLWVSAYFMVTLEHFDNLTGRLWTAVLLVQSVPYAASLLILLVNVFPSSETPSTTPKKGETSPVIH